MKDNTYTKKVLEARKKLLLLDKKVQLEILSVYKDASKTILSDIAKNKELNLSTKYLKKLNKSIEKYINELNQRLVLVTEKSITEASNIAKDLQMYYYQSIVPNKSINLACDAMCIKTTTNVVEKIVAGNFYKDKRSLDGRIWGCSNKNRKDIDRLIKANIARGANAKTLAKSLDNYVNPVKKTEAKMLEVGMNKSISYQAQRLARTSITHAFVETSVQNAINNPFCVGLQWNLSSQHYIRQVKWRGEDECDEYAEQNRYGLGEGVFPTEKYPIPHPNCLCYPTQVIVPINEASKFMNDWLNGMDNSNLDSWYDEINTETTNLYIPKIKYSSNDVKSKYGKTLNKKINSFESKIENTSSKYKKYTTGVKYEVTNELKTAFAYSIKDDIIKINPLSPIFKEYNFELSMMHELGHRVDLKELEIYKNIEFKDAILKSSNYVLNNLKEIQMEYDYLININDSPFLSDILGVLSFNKIEGLLATHNITYWQKQGNIEKEIFANLFALDYESDKHILSFIKKNIPDIYNVFNKVI